MTTASLSPKELLLACACRLGLLEVGVVSLPLSAQLEQILAADTAPCPFTPQDISARIAPEKLLPGARSVIVILFPYRPVDDRPETTSELRANIACYARSKDYHLIVRQYLDRLAARLAHHHPDDSFLPFVDTSPLPDRYLAYAAGLGYFGLNQCLINDRYGTYVVIGGIITTLEYPPDRPLERTCLQCEQCLRACPGQALHRGQFCYERCKSYITQKKGELSPEEITILRRTPYIFGCDTCQDVCPHNHRAEPSPLPEFAQDRILALTIDELAAHSNRTFREKHGDRAYAWRGKAVLLRNAELLADHPCPLPVEHEKIKP